MVSSTSSSMSTKQLLVNINREQCLRACIPRSLVASAWMCMELNELTKEAVVGDVHAVFLPANSHDWLIVLDHKQPACGHPFQARSITDELWEMETKYTMALHFQNEGEEEGSPWTAS